MTAVSSSLSEVERAARDAYGRLVASLAVRFRDVTAAEDAVGDALVRALETWPTSGVPTSPEAWLMTAAKRRLLERARHHEVTARFASEVTTIFEERLTASTPHASPPQTDDRLTLLFVCAHPAIDEAVRAPLMHQTVLGLDAATIASALLVSPSTMSQRLVRAKSRIRESAVPFERPAPEVVASRIDGVLEAIYAAFCLGSDAGATLESSTTAELVGEARFLAEVLEGLLPDHPEVLGLRSLMELSHARSRARFDESGEFVPLLEQDVTRWDREAIVRANERLNVAAAKRRPGPFQLEAAIQSAHCQRLFSGSTPWRPIEMLYAALSASSPTTSTTVGHAAALMEIGAFERARETLDSVEKGPRESYQPYWVVKAELARKEGDFSTFRSAIERAIGLTESPALRRYLAKRLAAEC